MTIMRLRIQSFQNFKEKCGNKYLIYPGQYGSITNLNDAVRFSQQFQDQEDWPKYSGYETKNILDFILRLQKLY